MTDVEINAMIPRTMTLAGLEFLGRLARTVPKNGLIVEVGPLFGSSTWVLAKNADPSVRVISIDTWEPQEWIKAVEAKFPGCKSFSKEAFDFYTADCPNVTAIQGFSPDVMKARAFNESIDLFFDDATHGDPGFSDSLAYYLPKLKPGGIAAGDDFASGWPDIVRRVTELAESWNARPEIIGRLWTLVKPGGADKQPSVYAKAGPYTDRDIAVSVRTTDGRTIECPPGAWAGFLHRPQIISAVKLDWAGPQSDGAEGVYQVLDHTATLSPWVGFGEWATTGDGKTAVAFRGHLLGVPGDVQLSYQACCIIRGRAGRVHTRNSKAFKDAAWTELSAPARRKDGTQQPTPRSAGLTALRLFVSTRDRGLSTEAD